MSTELQVMDDSVEFVDTFFDRVPVSTDWDIVRQQVKDGLITSGNTLNCLKAYEPLREADPRDHAHWVDQQRLRLALLHEAGKPLETNKTCESCGSRKVDPTYDNSYRKVCLHCAERDRQVETGGGGGSRGNCEFLHASFNPRSNQWGVLYYWSRGQDHKFMFWLADFFATREQAEMALWPMQHYHNWLTVKYNDLITDCLSFLDLLPLSRVMEMKLPLTPEELRATIRAAILEDIKKDRQLMSYYVSRAMDKHASAEDDE